jgi:hypothetical protein
LSFLYYISLLSSVVTSKLQFKFSISTFQTYFINHHKKMSHNAMENKAMNKENSSNPIFEPAGLATGIGSLPFTDARQALDLIWAELPEIPHWPQLPRIGKMEHFINQFLQPLVDCGMLVQYGHTWKFDTSSDSCAACMTDFYSVCLPAEDNDLNCSKSFLPSPESAFGFHAFLSMAKERGLEKAIYVKGQIAGPLSVALELKDQQGRPAYYQEDLRDMLVRTLALNARCQADALAFLGRTPIIFIDDPAVSAYGSRFHLALDRKEIIKDLNFIFSAIETAGAITGIHSCETVDWSLLLETRVRILSLDAYRFGDSLLPYSQYLHSFMERGGVVAWGIIPTLDDPFAESVDSLLRRLEVLWESLFSTGLQRSKVLQQSMITPACGVGLLPEDHARRIYRLTSELSHRLREKN